MHAAQRIEALRRKYGREYYIEVYGTAKNDVPEGGRGLVRVWRGDDWLSQRWVPFYPAEIAVYLEEQYFHIAGQEMIINSMAGPARAGIKMVEAQAQRRAIYASERRALWPQWQDWIDKQRQQNKWSLRRTARAGNQYQRAAVVRPARRAALRWRLPGRPVSRAPVR